MIWLYKTLSFLYQNLIIIIIITYEIQWELGVENFDKLFQAFYLPYILVTKRLWFCFSPYNLNLFNLKDLEMFVIPMLAYSLNETF